MQGMKDLIGSERGIFCILLVLGCTAGWLTGAMTVEQWIDYTKWIAGFLVASKTVTTAIEMMKKPSSPIPVATSQPPSA